MDPKSGLFPIPVDVRTEIIKARKIRKQKKTKNRVGSIEHSHSADKKTVLQSAHKLKGSLASELRIPNPVWRG